MKSKAQVLKDNSQYKTLINAVIRDLGGTDYVEDVIRGGADAGFPGFTYYNDTHAFAMRYRKMIVSLLNEQADQLGEEVVTMVKGFGVFRNSPADSEDLQHLYKYIWGGRPEQGTITNVMAWFALEEVCRMFED